MKQLVELGDVCEVIAGQSPPSSSYNDTNNGLPFFQGKSDFGHLYPKIRIWCSEPKKISLPNDILISVRAPVGPTNINNIKSCIGRGLSAIRCSDKINQKFLLHFLRFNEHKITDKGTGSTFKAITQKELKTLLIPLPPLAEQKQLATILDAADKLRQKDQQLVEHYTALSQSLFLDMFGDPVTNPMAWTKDISIKHSNCIVPGRDKPKAFTGEIPWITTSDLNHLSYSSNSIQGLGLSISEIEMVKAKVIPKNSVILTCVGDLGIVSINTRPVVVNQQLHTFQCDNENISPLFMMYALSHQTPYMYKMSSSTTVPYMNKTICNNIPMIYPPIRLQNQFAERIAIIEQQKQQAQQNLEKSEMLFNSLLQSAFTGELTANKAA